VSKPIKTRRLSFILTACLPADIQDGRGACRLNCLMVKRVTGAGSPLPENASDSETHLILAIFEYFFAKIRVSIMSQVS
jgi:hypothetical protein